jgi:hypothetical protein
VIKFVNEDEWFSPDTLDTSISRTECHNITELSVNFQNIQKTSKLEYLYRFY